MLKLAFRAKTQGSTSTFNWFAKFISGVTPVENVPYSEHPAMSNTDKNAVPNKDIIFVNKCVTVRDLLMKWESHLDHVRAF